MKVTICRSFAPLFLYNSSAHRGYAAYVECGLLSSPPPQVSVNCRAFKVPRTISSLTVSLTGRCLPRQLPFSLRLPSSSPPLFPPPPTSPSIADPLPPFVSMMSWVRENVLFEGRPTRMSRGIRSLYVFVVFAYLVCFSPSSYSVWIGAPLSPIFDRSPGF